MVARSGHRPAWKTNGHKHPHAHSSLQEAGNQAEDEDELYYVVEDPSQPECAISGERFERFFDPEEDKWCFKDAVVLYGEDADK